MRSAINKFHATTTTIRTQHQRKLFQSIQMLNHDLISQVSKCPNSDAKRKYSSSTRLAEVGRFETKQPDDDLYTPGQPFLHQIFGYRGVILFPWLARVHDIDARKHNKTSGTGNNSFKTKTESHNNGKQAKTKIENSSPKTTDSKQDSSSQQQSTQKQSQSYVQYDPTLDGSIPPSRMAANSTKFHPYYQVLIDTRDCPFVSNRTQTEAVTFLNNPDNSKSVYSIKGLDYVAHEDILPYTSYEETPIQHELHKKLFKFNQEPGNKVRYNATDLLGSWQNKHPWLDLSRIYRETTEDIRVTVIPFYLGHTTIEEISFHWWRYCVRLENLSNHSVQLRERHWKIFSQTSMLQTIKGRGVVGVEPILTKNEPAYQYSSHINLQDKSGHMWGTFKMQREDGHTFECRIPPFSLESSLIN